MANKTRLEELIELIVIEYGDRGSRKVCKNYFDAFYKVFLKQLEISGKIRIPTFGTFYLEQRKENITRVGNRKTKKANYAYVEPRYYVTFKPSSELDRNLNENEFVKRKTKKVKNKNDSSAMNQLVNILNDVERRKNG